MAPYLTYVYPKSDSFKTLHNCGLKTVLYLAPSTPESPDPDYTLMPSSYPDTQAKDCAGTPIVGPSNGYLLDPHAPDAAAFYQASLDAHIAKIVAYNGAGYVDAIFSDNSGNGFGYATTPCTWKGFADWTAATTSMLAQVNPRGAQLFLNVLTLPVAWSVQPSGDTPQNAVNTVLPASVTGGEAEGFLYDSYGTTHFERWPVQINTEILTVAAHRVFWAYADHKLASLDPTSATGIAARTWLYVSWLLGYDPTYAIFQEWFTTPSGLKVMPETGLVPLQPLQTATSDISQLRAASGLYVRQFGACYYRGALIGACEAVVNPTSATIALDPGAFTHAMALSGSDVLDGGTATFTAPVPSTMGPNTGAILVP